MNPTKKFNPTVEEIRALHAIGFSDEAIGRRYGVHLKSVQKFRKLHNILEARKPCRSIEELRPNEVKMMVEAGMGDRSIAYAVGLTWSSICNFRERHGIPSALATGGKPEQPPGLARHTPPDPETEWTRLLAGRRF